MTIMRLPGLDLFGLALLNSIWQMGLLNLLYLIIAGRDTRYSAAFRHNLAICLSVAGTVWFLSGFISPLEYLPRLSLQSGQEGSSSGSNFFRKWAVVYGDRLILLLSWLYLIILLLRTTFFLGRMLRKWSRPGSPLVLPELAAEWAGFMEQCRRDMKIRRKVVLQWMTGPGMAFTSGFFRPVVFFPLALLTRLSTSQVEAILVHELAHIRRNDYLTHLWISFFHFVFYFNPFARFLFEVVSREREQACDDLVLCRAYPATAYAQALMTLEQFRQSQISIALGAAGDRPRQLADRIRRICGLPAIPAGGRPLINRLACLALFVTLVYAVSPALTKRFIPSSAIRSATIRSATIRNTEFRPTWPDIAVQPKTIDNLKTCPPVVATGPSIRLTILPCKPTMPPTVATDRILEDEKVPGEDAVVSNVEESRADMSADSSAEEIKILETNEEADDWDQAFASGRQIRNFSYRNPLAPPPPPALKGSLPYIPSSSFEYSVADSVPVIALQSLRENKPAVLQLLAQWKAFQWQQNLSRALEAQYRKLKQAGSRQLKGMPAEKGELKKALHQLEIQMKTRKAEIDRISAQLAEGPVIYI